MTLAPEDFVERRRLRRRASFWRIAAIAAAALFVIALVARFGTAGFGGVAPHVARVNVSGVIGNDEKLLQLLDGIAENDAVQALVVHVDSPGGTAVGGEATFAKLREVAGEKPVVAQVETLAASAGYMVAAAADHIVARNTSIVGSIGVIVQVPNVNELLDRVGVDVRTIKSTPLKAEPSVVGPVNPEAEEMMRRMVLSSYSWFVDLVEDRRNMTGNQIAAVSDGSVFSGLQGLENGLVDALGGEDAVEAYLATREVSADLPTLLYEPQRETGLFGAVARASEAAGKGLRAGMGIDEQLMRLGLVDGIVSLWQGTR